MRRTQIYLNERQLADLRSTAKASRLSVSEVIREAIDEKLARPSDRDEFERALTAVAGLWANRSDLGSTDDYLRQIRADRRGVPTP